MPKGIPKKTTELAKKEKSYPLPRSIGRPRALNSPEQAEELINAYFGSVEPRQWTVTGLSIALGFCSRNTLFEYAKKEEYRDTIRKAKQMVEASYEVDLKERGHAGTIFALKNFDWKDRSEVEMTHTLHERVKEHGEEGVVVSWDDQDHDIIDV